MKPIKSTLIAALAMSAAITVNAKPAKPGNRIITQPDGTTLIVHTVGNAFCHYTLTDDNKVLVKDGNGQYSYAKVGTDGTLQSTSVQAHNSAVRSADEAAFAVDLSSIEKNTVRKERRRANAQTGVGRFEEGFPNEGTIRGVMILVNYTDDQFKTGSFYETTALDYFTNMINQTGFSESKATGSAKDYFSDMSSGRFLIDFDVVGPYTLSNNYAYYGKDDAWGWDQHADEMVVEACNLADADVNFADYDNDKDGKCDFVYIVYAGTAASDGEDDDRIWPHSYFLSYTQKQITLDNVVVDKYACSNERDYSRPDGVGTFVHEFSHVMGLPDLYYTGDGKYLYCTPGDYSVLDVGCYNNASRTPVAYSSYEKNAMDWIDLKELSKPEDVTLRNLTDYNEACIIKTNRDDEFYLLENRQKTGWDAYIPNSGMLIWHIDGTQKVYDDNTVNNDKSHQYVDIVEANGKANNERQNYMKGWTWPGTSNKTEFTSETTPALKDWDGNAIDVPITEIAEEDGLITFKAKGGSAGVHDITLINAAETTQIEYYNLQGIRVSKPAHGLYIARTGNTTAKVMVQ